MAYFDNYIGDERFETKKKTITFFVFLIFLIRNPRKVT